MTANEVRLRKALAQIHDLASASLLEQLALEPGDPNVSQGERLLVGCTIKMLPNDLQFEAASKAVEINPQNSPLAGGLALALSDELLDRNKIAVLTKRRWAPQVRRLSVSFIETTPRDLRSKIVFHMNAWSKTSCIEFVETAGTGDVRVSREAGGYWSYLGTDILMITPDRPTMNLEGFSMSDTPDSEFYRVVRHEAGHTLGFPHEHMRKALVMRIDPAKAYDYFWKTQGWDKKTVDQQVLKSLDDNSIIGTPPDQTSIMCYQLPASITKDGNPILGGRDINRTDFEFAGKIYPKPARTTRRNSDDEEIVSDQPAHGQCNNGE